MSRSRKADLLLILVTFLWGATFVLVKDALEDISPFLFNALRFSLGTAALVLIYRRHLKRFTAGSLRSGLIVGTFLWLGYEFQNAGLKRTTPSKAAFITGLAVVLVPLLLAIFWKKMVNAWAGAGVVSALVGMYLLTVPASANGGLNLASMNRGDLLVLGASVAFAFHIIFLGHASQQHDFEQIAILQAGVAAILMTITVPVAEKIYITWSPPVIWAILVTALGCTAAGFTIQAWAQQFTPATHTALIVSLEPVFAWVVAFFVTGERLGRRSGVGAILMLSGVLLSELKGRSEPAIPGGNVGPEAGESSKNLSLPAEASADGSRQS
jgi:drug/metabolite transporter (DMT)-like permease